MKKLITLITSILLLSCNQESEKYENILKEFKKNYTINKQISKKDILLCWNITDDKFKKDSLDYEKAYILFYKQDKKFLFYLLSFKNDTSHYNNWIESKNPCSSTIDDTYFINNSDASLILIDNFLLENKNQTKFKKSRYLNKIKYNDVEVIIKSKNSLKSVRTSYLKYIESIK